MGPSTYIRSVVDRNVVMRRIPVLRWKVWRTGGRYRQGKTKCLEEILFRCHYLHRKFHMDWPGPSQLSLLQKPFVSFVTVLSTLVLMGCRGGSVDTGFVCNSAATLGAAIKGSLPAIKVTPVTVVFRDWLIDIHLGSSLYGPDTSGS
jgi:hypothetical protein